MVRDAILAGEHKTIIPLLVGLLFIGID